MDEHEIPDLHAPSVQVDNIEHARRFTTEFFTTRACPDFHTLPQAKIDSARDSRGLPEPEVRPFDFQACQKSYLDSLPHTFDTFRILHATGYHRAFSSGTIGISRAEARFWLRVLTHPYRFSKAHYKMGVFSSIDTAQIEGEELTLDEAKELLRRFDAVLTRITRNTAHGVYYASSASFFEPIAVCLRTLYGEDGALDALLDAFAIKRCHSGLRKLTHATDPDVIARKCAIVERYIARTPEMPQSHMINLLACAPVNKHLEQALIALGENARRKNGVWDQETYERLLTLITDPDLFIKVVHDSPHALNYTPRVFILQLALDGCRNLDRALARADRVVGTWSIGEWGIMLRAHSVSVARLALRIIHNPKHLIAESARKWLLEEGYNAIIACIQDIEERRQLSDKVRWVLEKYVRMGARDIITRAMEDLNLGERETSALLEVLSREELTSCDLPELEPQDYPSWLARWSKRGLKQPYPRGLEAELIPPLLNSARTHQLSPGAKIGTLRLLQKLHRKPAGALDEVRASLDAESLASVARFVHALWERNGKRTAMNWMASALGSIGDEACLEELLAAVPIATKEDKKKPYLRHLFQLDDWIGYGLIASGQRRAYARIVENYLSRIKHLSEDVKRQDKFIELAAKNLGLSYSEFLESMAPELGTPLKGALAFEVNQTRYVARVDDAQQLMLEHDRGGAAVAVDTTHPKQAHRDALERAQREHDRLTSILEGVYDVAKERGDSWGYRSWTRANENPFAAALKRRVLWTLRSKERAFDGVQVRLCEDLTIADIDDDHLAPPGSATIEITRVEDLSANERVAWGQLFAEHELHALLQDFTTDTSAS